MRIDLPGEHPLGKDPKQGGLLRPHPVVSGLCDALRLAALVHVEPAALDGKFRPVDVEAQGGPGERQHKIANFEEAAFPADRGPLGVLCRERAVERSGDSVREKQIALERQRNGGGPARRLRLGANPADYRHGHFIAQRPERESQAIPPQIPQATERLQRAVRPGHGRKKFRVLRKTELRGDVPEGAQALPFIEHGAHPLQTPAVHEHDAVHVLDAVAGARRDDLLHLRRRAPGRLLRQHVLAGLGRADGPLGSDSRRERNINGVDVRPGQQCLVAADRDGNLRMRHLRLTFGDERSRARRVATGHGDQRGVAGVADSLPVFARDIRSSQNTPATKRMAHRAIKKRLRPVGNNRRHPGTDFLPAQAKPLSAAAPPSASPP